MRQKILFADLNHYETTYLQKELCGRYETAESFYAEDTLRILSQEYQDTKAILIGWELFWANDYACISKIKENPDYQLIPVVVIDSSHSEAVDNVFRYHEALRHGALGFFSAPFDVPMIQTFMNSIILLGEGSGDTLQVPDRQSSRSKQFETLIQHFNGGITIAYDGFIAREYAYINEPFFSIFGYTREEFLEELSGSIYNLILPAYVSEVKAALGNSATQIKPVQFVFQAMKKDGSKIWIRCRSSIHYLSGQGQIAYIIFYDDITALKKTEDRISTVNEKLANSEIYLHLNLKERVIEDYRSVYEPENQISKAKNKDYRDFLLAHVYEADQDKLWSILAYDNLIESYRSGNTKLSSEYRKKMPNGSIRWFAVTVVLIEGMGEVDSSALIYAHDIDEKMKTQIAKDRVADLEVNDIAIVNIASGKVSYIKKHRNLSGGEEERPQYEDILEQLINVEIAKEDRERCRNYFRLKNLVPCISEHGSASISYWITTKKGNNIRANVTATYLDETHEDILLLGRDITVLFEKEQEQQMALQHAVELADFANQSKSQFLSRMSHDMRTPLNAILGLTRLAQDEKQLSVLQEYCNSIRVSGEFLLGLINDLLDLSKIESGKMEFHREVFSLEEFLLGIDTVIRPLMEAKKIDFVVHLKKQSSPIVVDKMRFNQVFYNLLSNAVKYTPEGGRVEFWSEYIPQKEKKFACDSMSVIMESE